MPQSPTDAKFRGTDRFELVSELGSGASGVVYEVLDRERGEHVALKTLHGVNKRALITLKNEYRSLREVTHPNLVTLGELIEESGEWFFTMELIEGSDFSTYVRPDGALDARRLQTSLTQLAHALEFLHDHDKIHRDIKPSNIRVTPEGRAVLLDFGLVIARETSAASGYVVGTAEYMAPEQARGKPLGPEADIYALGVVVYEALTGAVPFTSDNMFQLGLRKNAVDPPPPREVCAGVPTHLDSLCMWMLARRPAQRPRARDITDALTVDDHLEPVRPRRRPRPAAVEFVGRYDELSAMSNALERVRAGASRAVFIHGDSGVGKSELVRQFTTLVREYYDDTVVLAGRCYERETVPYNALDEIVDAIATYTAELPHDEILATSGPDAHLAADMFPVLRRITAFDLVSHPDVDRVDPTVLRRRGFEATRRLLDSMIGDRTAILCIDDVHGADDGSRALLSHLMHEMTSRCLFLLTARGRTRGESLEWVPCPVDELGVEPMPEADATELAERLLERSGRTGDAAAAIAATAAGHPLFIHELAYRSGDELPEGAGIDDLVWQRVQAEERAGRRTLALLAIAGVPLEQAALAAAANVDYPAFHELVDRLRDGHLVRTNGVLRTDSIEVYHNRVRWALLDRTEEAALARLHHRLAETLEATDPDNVSSLAYHWLAAGAVDRAFDCMVEAAQRATRSLAFERAAELYTAAIDLGASTDAGTRRLRAKLGAALFNAGRSYDGAQQYLAAAQGSSDIAASELARRGAAALLSCGHVAAGMRVLDDVMDGLGLVVPERAPDAPSYTRLPSGFGRHSVDLDPNELARIDVCWSVASGLADIDPDTAARFQSRHLEMALDSADTYCIGRALAQEAILAAARTGSRHERHASRALVQLGMITESTDDTHLLALNTLARAALATHRADWRTGGGLAARAELILTEQCAGVATELVAARLLRFTCMVNLGHLEPLIGLLHAALAEAEQRGDRYATSTLRTGAINLSWLVAVSPEEARAHVRAAMRDWHDEPGTLQHARALIAETNILLYTGAVDDAWRLLDERWPRIAASSAMDSALLRAELLFARGRTAIACAARGVDDALTRSALDDAQELERDDLAYAAGAAHVMRAGLAAITSEPETAARELEQAEAVFTRLEMPIHIAAVQACRGEPNAAADLRGLGVRDPLATIGLLVPGFDQFE